MQSPDLSTCLNLDGLFGPLRHYVAERTTNSYVFRRRDGRGRSLSVPSLAVHASYVHARIPDAVDAFLEHLPHLCHDCGFPLPERTGLCGECEQATVADLNRMAELYQ